MIGLIIGVAVSLIAILYFTFRQGQKSERLDSHEETLQEAGRVAKIRAHIDSLNIVDIRDRLRKWTK